MKAAEALRDNHVVKMPSESGQLLSAWADYHEENNHLGNYVPLPEFPRMDYPPSVPNHPCCLWLKKGHGNVLWLVRHMHGLHVQHSHRYDSQGKFVKSKAMVEILEPWLLNFVMLNWTQPVQALGPNGHLYYVEGDPVAGYRRYYSAEKLPGAKYTPPGVVPDWAPYVPPVIKKKISAKGLTIGGPKLPKINVGIANLKIKRN